MKLCADILYWRLKEELKTVELHGAGSLELTLSRPEFYLDRTQTFEKNRVYVCSADHLPARPSLRENVCLVCLGQHWNLTAFYDRCSVIVVEADTDIFRVFNLVQHIFDRYEAWEERLWHILRHGASLSQMLASVCPAVPAAAAHAHGWKGRAGTETSPFSPHQTSRYPAGYRDFFENIPRLSQQDTGSPNRSAAWGLKECCS